MRLQFYRNDTMLSVLSRWVQLYPHHKNGKYLKVMAFGKSILYLGFVP